jgi:2-succinyl-5-enolpyruvyl-6-hydroxy-3-cyclohexene-1-carboxylate synthase
MDPTNANTALASAFAEELARCGLRHAVRWFCEVGTHEADDDGLLHLRSTACRAFAAARGEPRLGPVHLNSPLREPPKLWLEAESTAREAIAPLRTMSNRTDGPSLNAALAQTGALLGAFSLLVSAGLLLAA